MRTDPEIARRRHLETAVDAGLLVDVQKHFRADDPELELEGLFERAAGAPNAPELLAWLAKQGLDVRAEPGGHALAKAFLRTRAENVAWLLAAGADPNRLYEQHFDTCPLFSAIRYGTLRAIKLALESGCDATVTTSKGFGSAVEVLAWSTKLEDEQLPAVLRLLVEHGAPVDAVARDGRTPLHHAASRGKLELVRALLERGADPSRRGAGKTAAQHASTGAVRKLLAGPRPAPAGKVEPAKKVATSKKVATPKKVATSERLGLDIHALYRIYQGNLFEGAWMGNERLAKALLDWVAEHHPRLAKNAKGSPLHAEVLVRDEVGAVAVGEFIASLPPARRRAALRLILDDIRSLVGVDAVRLRAALAAAIA